MSLVASYPFTDFSQVQGVSGDGRVLAGASYPKGIPNVLTIENGMMRAFLTDSHAITTIGHRTEIYLTVDANSGEVWYSWEFMLPAVYWQGYSTGGLTIGQMHDTGDAGDPARQPIFMLQAFNGNLCVTWPRAVLPTQSVSFTRIPVTPLEYDRWYSVCVRNNLQITTEGFREVFIDRIPVYREWGVATTYDDAIGPYFKLGIYNTSGGLSGDKVAYFRNLKRWTGNDGYQAVMGGVPLIRPTLSQI
jgi:hypothetical protein